MNNNQEQKTELKIKINPIQIAVFIGMLLGIIAVFDFDCALSFKIIWIFALAPAGALAGYFCGIFLTLRFDSWGFNKNQKEVATNHDKKK